MDDHALESDFESIALNPVLHGVDLAMERLLVFGLLEPESESCLNALRYELATDGLVPRMAKAMHFAAHAECKNPTCDYTQDDAGWFEPLAAAALRIFLAAAPKKGA